MPIATEVLSTILPEWRALLQGWAASGQLAAAANEALLLSRNQEAQLQLEQLTSKWGSGDFSNLPPIVLLSAEDISEAYGAYAASTGTIYLNSIFLLLARPEEIIGVLSEEFGHALDSALNTQDTPGDEGHLFSELLLNSDQCSVGAESNAQENDYIVVTTPNGQIGAEAASPSYIDIYTTNPPAHRLISASTQRARVEVIGYYGMANQIYFGVNNSNLDYWLTAGPCSCGDGVGNDVVAQRINSWMNSTYGGTVASSMLTSTSFLIESKSAGSFSLQAAVSIGWSGGYYAGLRFYADTGEASFKVDVPIFGNTLSAVKIGDDPDGNGIFAYIWQTLLDGGDWSPVGGDESTYSIAPEDEGKYIRLKVVYADGSGFSEAAIASVGYIPISNNGTGTLGAISGNGAFTEGVTLTAGSVTGDPDGAATITAYQWYLNGNAISGATASTYVVGPQGAGSYTVAVSYTDAQNFSATLTSAAQAVTAVNNGQGTLSAITGNGAFQEGVTLSAGEVTGDPDGAATATTYQWYLNGNAIASATASTYTVGPQGAGSYAVAVSYTDAQNFSATLTSAAQVVTAVNNGNGTLSAISGNGSFQEGVTLSAGAVTGDPDGAATATAYQWYFNDAIITGATGASYTTSATGTGNYKVAVTYSDGQSYSATLTSANQAVSQVNNGNGNLAAISGNGAFQEGVTLSAGAITGDPDGAATITAYQWYFNDAIITGATGASYTTSATGTGNYKVAVTYSDGQSYSATLTSANQAVAKIDNGQGALAISGTTVVGSTLTVSSINGDPEGLAAVPNITYSWYRNGAQITGANASSYQLVSADAGSKISVRASYLDGQSYSATVTSAETAAISSPADTTAPVVTAMSIEGNGLTLTFSEAVKGTSLSAANYTVLVAGVSRSVGAIGFDSNSSNKVIMTLSGTSAPTATQTLTVKYTLPSGNPTAGIVTDLAGNPLQSFPESPVSMFISGSTIGSSTRPLQANYIGAVLTGSSIINAYGNAQNNAITGNSAANRLYGGLGNDALIGGGGNDSLYGGGGLDTLTGGLASDSFYLDVKPSTLSASTVDHIADFNAAESDKIIFNRTSFGFSSTTVSLTTISATSQLTAALATTTVFVYDSSTGYLHWNQNGATAGAGTGGIVVALDSQGVVFPFLGTANLSIA